MKKKLIACFIGKIFANCYRYIVACLLGNLLTQHKAIYYMVTLLRIHTKYCINKYHSIIVYL